jgi:chaperonin GroES
MKPSKKTVICEAVNVSTVGVLQMAQEEKKPEVGKVLSIGEGKLPVEIKIGDTIVYRRYTDNKISINGKEYNFISFKDILAVV